MRRSYQLSAISYQPAFSLVELMIAIMILGLGMVMVATVFPVSLDMTRSTLQMGIANSAMDVAFATLKLKLPRAANPPLVDKSLASLPPSLSAKVLFPDMFSIEFGASPAVIDANEYPVEWPSPVAGPLPRMAFSAFAAWDNNPPSTTPPTPPNPPIGGNAWPGSGPAAYVALSRAYTEQTFWDAEGTSLGGGTSFVVDSANLLADSGAPMLESPPYITDGKPQPAQPGPVGIYLTDRVYPPLNVESDGSGTGYRYYNRNWVNPSEQWLAAPNLGFLSVLVAPVIRDGNQDWGEAPRRYAWTAIHRKGLSFNTNHTFICTVVVTYRGDLNARYARQLHPPSGSGNGANGRYFLGDWNIAYPLLSAPAPELVTTNDMVFPQAWLVALASIDTVTGAVICAPRVARLLPADSYFIIAQANGGGGAFDAGTPHKVIGNDYRPEMMTSTNPCTLQIPRMGGGGQFGPVAVWVFPPAIEADRATFGNRSPVVGVSLGEVRPQ